MKKKSTNLRAVATAIALFSIATPSKLMAQDKVEASVGADIVSGYIWRGQDLGGVSLQPTLGVAYKGFSLEAWGSVGIDSKDAKEIDLTLGYTIGGFSASVIDYWFSGGPGYFHYSTDNTSHVFEAQIGYDFGLLSLNWHTNFAGADGVNNNDERAYSSYIAVAAPFKLGGLNWTAEVGATPWATDYYDAEGFAVCDISLGASKAIKITKSFSLPLSAKITWNPNTEGVYFVAGLNF